MNIESLIEWKKKIEAMNKYIAIPMFDSIKGNLVDIMEPSVLNKDKVTSKVADIIDEYYKKSILVSSSEEKFDEANLYLSLYLITEKKEFNDRKQLISDSDFIDDCVLVEPSINITTTDDEIVEIGDKEGVIPYYVVSYKEFFNQMKERGYDFNVKSFDKLKHDLYFLNSKDSIGIVSTKIDFKQTDEKRPLI